MTQTTAAGVATYVNDSWSIQIMSLCFLQQQKQITSSELIQITPTDVSSFVQIHCFSKAVLETDCGLVTRMMCAAA